MDFPEGPDTNARGSRNIAYPLDRFLLYLLENHWTYTGMAPKEEKDR